MDPEDNSIQSKMISCPRHGDRRQEAFVCGHLLHGEAQGFFFDPDEDSLNPDAWCRDCEQLRKEDGGEWTEALTNAADIQLVCEDCYTEIRQRNLADVN
jgi:hypothetical protein